MHLFSGWVQFSLVVNLAEDEMIVGSNSTIPTIYKFYESYFDLLITSSAYQFISAIIPSKVLSSAPPS